MIVESQKIRELDAGRLGRRTDDRLEPMDRNRDKLRIGPEHGESSGAAEQGTAIA
jgi:hypothetical protein